MSLTLTPTVPTPLLLSAGGGNVATDVIWDAKGDLAVGTAPDTAVKLPVGPNGQVLTADSAQTLGIKWAALPGGGMVADTLWDAKGDLAVATGADAAAKLPVGPNGQILTADSAQATGIKWAAAPAGAISGVTVTGTAAAGQAPIASSSSAGAWAYPPGYEIGYDQITSVVNITGTTEAAPTTIITCAAHTFDGGPCYAEFDGLVELPTVTGWVVVSLYESTTVINHFLYVQNGAGASGQLILPGTSSCRFTPSAGSHSYTVKAYASVTTGTPAIAGGVGGVGNNAPSFIKFTKA